MTRTTTEFEQELRQLYAAIEAPAPPTPRIVTDAAVTPVPVVMPGRRAVWRNPAARRGLALVSAAAVVAVGTITATHRGGDPAPSARPPVSALSVAVLPAGASLGCSLPIRALSADNTTGFIVLNNGRASFQPAQVPSGSQQLLGWSYLAPLHRWVDGAPRRADANDVTYMSETGDPTSQTITVHDAHADRVVLRDRFDGNGNPPRSVMGWLGGEIVLYAPGAMLPNGGELKPSHIELLNPDTGAVRTVPNAPPDMRPVGLGQTSTAYVRGTGATWTVVSHDGGSGSTLDRYDLTTGVITREYNATGFIQVVGADRNGRPIIQVADADILHVNPAQRRGISTSTMLLTGAQQATVLNHGRVGEIGVAEDLSPGSIRDGDTVWMAADNGQIWTYRPSTGMQLVAQITTSTRGAPGVVVGGPCR